MHYPAFDPVVCGELIIAARAFAHCARSPKRFCDKLAREGVELSVAELRELEAGRAEQVPLPFARAVCKVARVPVSHFDRAFARNLRGLDETA
jgi:hypothetical protein